MAQNKPTKETTSQTLLRSTLFWIGVLIYVALPFVTYFILQTVVINVEGNIAYKEITPTVSAIANLIAVFTSYAGIGLVAVTIAYFGVKKAKHTVILCISSQFIGVIFSMLAYTLSGARNYQVALFSLGIDAFFTTLIYVGIIVSVHFIRKSKLTHHGNAVPELDGKIVSRGGIYTYLFGSVGIYAAVQIIAKLYDMISKFIDPSYGLPVNLTEQLYWPTEFVKLFIYASLGYLISLGAFYLAKYYLKHYQE